MEGNDPITRGESGDPGASGGYHARCLVTVDARPGQQVILDLLQVGMTDTTGFDTDQDFPWTDSRGSDFLDLNGLVSHVNRRFHGSR